MYSGQLDGPMPHPSKSGYSHPRFLPSQWAQSASRHSILAICSPFQVIALYHTISIVNYFSPILSTSTLSSKTFAKMKAMPKWVMASAPSGPPLSHRAIAMSAQMAAIAYQRMLWMRFPSTLLIGADLPVLPHLMTHHLYGTHAPAGHAGDFPIGNVVFHNQPPLPIPPPRVTDIIIAGAQGIVPLPLSVAVLPCPLAVREVLQCLRHSRLLELTAPIGIGAVHVSTRGAVAGGQVGASRAGEQVRRRAPAAANQPAVHEVPTGAMTAPVRQSVEIIVFQPFRDHIHHGGPILTHGQHLVPPP